MPEIRSQVASNDYRANWERVFRKHKVTAYQALEYCGVPMTINEQVPKDEIWFVKEGEIVAKMTNVGAPENA